MSKRQQQKQETKKRIVSAAYGVFAKNGFSAATSDIAAATGVSHGTIFVHFPTRDDLLIYLLNDFGLKVGSRLHELARNSEDTPDVLRAHLNAIKEHEDFYTRLISESRLLPSEVRNTFVAMQSAIAFHLNEVLEREMDGGSVKRMPVHMIFNTWIGLVHYYLQNSDIFAPESSVLERYGDELIKRFLELIKK